VYFPGLNGLRFLAALLVIVSHVEEMKRHFGYANYRSVPAIQHMGGAAVTFFFVLSGFLITYLLLEEKRKTGTVSLPTFYLKRLLRIWPLYYLVVALGLFVLPHVPALIVPRFAEAYAQAPAVLPALFLSFLPNMALAVYGFTPYLVQTWSIGVEEQFYLIWPLVLLYAPRPLRAMLATVGVYIGAFVLVRLALAAGAYLPDTLTLFLSKLLSFIKLTRLDCMAIGGVGAYLLFTGRRTLLALLYHPVTEGLAWGLAAVLIAKGVAFKAIFHEIYAVLFLVIILNVASNPGILTTQVLENRMMRYLGQISYGLYMYHFIVVGVVLAALRNYLPGQPRWLADLGIYALTLLGTVAVSAVSFHAFENKIIRLRPWLQRRLGRRRKTRLVPGCRLPGIG
jgi:peptidoglycan/LPS O-acetylase OafA/YrhL